MFLFVSDFAVFVTILEMKTALVASFAAAASAITNPEEYVNILGGTDSHYDLSHGMIWIHLCMLCLGL
jgi:hypothetical protein